jgi:predicted ATPase/DNA-binding CsgD family transcriptional regulator
MTLLERERPLAALAEAHAAAARGDGRVVLVTGEAGIGKTALVTRFVAGLAARSRVLWGTCDDLSIPRPLGPFRDLVDDVSAPLARALGAAAAPHEIQTLLAAELAHDPPTVLVVEDVHWADDATLDVVAYVGRRIVALPALLVLTVRSGEAPPEHRLHATIGSLSGPALVLELEHLTPNAVAELAGEDAERVYALTRGNPFFVTELVAGGGEVPPSVANAVLGRAARLGEDARRLVELVSVVPARVPTSLLDALLPGWAAAAEEPERRGLLEVDAQHVRFRHELARNAVRSSVPVARRRRLHGAIAAAVAAAGGHPAEIVHHAELAGDEPRVAEFALAAARRAAAVESNREAYAHFTRAADFADRHPLAERATLFEELARAAYAVDRLDDAFRAIERAIASFTAVDDREGLGRCTRLLSRFHWFAGEGAEARERAREAIEILEPLGESAELARAYSALSQLAMLAGDAGRAIELGTKAQALALRFGDERTRAHALVNIGSAELQDDPDAVEKLLEAHAIADAAGDGHEATRALVNLAYSLLFWVRPVAAQEHARRAAAYAEAHEVHTLASYAATIVAWTRARSGDWEQAEAAAAAELERDVSVSQLLARTVLTEVAVRRGDERARELLDELAEQAERTGELQRVGPVLELETEWALTRGAPLPAERFARLRDRLARSAAGWGAARAVAWAAVAGVDLPLDEPVSDPHAAMLRRDWPAAAEAFAQVGWPYDAALMLLLVDDERALVEALSTARRLGAEPLERRVARRLRELGLAVPRAPRATTRANPLGLTSRQYEVLELLASGLTNAEIADRLVVSPRTAEHHVAAVLGKLGVPSRRDAARRAAELGLLNGRA